jgi:hypothetical protein
MSLRAIKNSVTSRVGRQVLVTQKHSPTLLVGAGIVGVIATVVLASRATLKMEEVLREAEEKDNQIKGAVALETENYSEEDARKDKLGVRVQTAGKIVKLYAPAAIVGVLSIGALAGSHVILSRRNVALTAAYAAVDRGFKEYRQRVVEEFGELKDREFRFGMVENELAVDTDDGVAVKTVKGVDSKSFEEFGYSIYAKLFDEYNRYWKKEWSMNQLFLQCQQNYANDALRANGHLFLNEVYDMLGLPRTKAGAVVGWVKGHGDDTINFGIAETYDGMRFIKGQERSVVLDFNVHGVILDLI